MDLDENDIDFSDVVHEISRQAYVLANGIDVFSRYSMAFSDFIDEIWRYTMDETHHSIVRAPGSMDLSRPMPS